jgi:predicted nucleic acid-binding protein
VRTFSALARVPVDLDLVYSAIELRGSKSVSYWDALIIAAATRADCSQLITEDLNAGEVIAGVEIVNPFAER